MNNRTGESERKRERDRAIFLPARFWSYAFPCMITTWGEKIHIQGLDQSKAVFFSGKLPHPAAIKIHQKLCTILLYMEQVGFLTFLLSDGINNNFSHYISPYSWDFFQRTLVFFVHRIRSNIRMNNISKSFLAKSIIISCQSHTILIKWNKWLQQGRGKTHSPLSVFSNAWRGGCIYLWFVKYDLGGSSKCKFEAMYQIIRHIFKHVSLFLAFRVLCVA